MKVIAFQYNGNVHVDYPKAGLDIEKHAKRVVPANTPYVILEHTELPVRDEHRDCWSLKSGKVEFDLEKFTLKGNRLMEKQAKKNALLAKLGLNAEELKSLKEIING